VGTSYNWGVTTAHELGHYLFGLGDEYEDLESCLDVPGTPSRGKCYHAGAPPAFRTPSGYDHQCIMQSPTVLDWSTNTTVDATEFCRSTTHGAASLLCDSEPNSTKQLFGIVMNEQHQRWGKSCWATMKERQPWLALPASVNRTAPPSGPTSANLTDRRGNENAIAFLLDTSGSMNTFISR
jgi:hypothetical protein